MKHFSPILFTAIYTIRLSPSFKICIKTTLFPPQWLRVTPTIPLVCSAEQGNNFALFQFKGQMANQLRCSDFYIRHAVEVLVLSRAQRTVCNLVQRAYDLNWSSS